jgi:hypothetical protein
MTVPTLGVSRFVAFSSIDDEPWEAGSEARTLLDRVRELASLGIGVVRFTEILDCGSEANDVLNGGLTLPEARERFRTVFRGEGVPELGPVAFRDGEP